MSRKRFAFTLIELLIVIAIIGILIASIAVAVTKAKEFANNSDQKNNMKNIVTACRIAEVENGRYPSAYTQYGRKPINPNTGKPVNINQPTVFVSLLPYLENKALYDASWNGNSPDPSSLTPVRVFLSLMDPSIPSPIGGQTSFSANIRVFSTTGQSTPYTASIDVSDSNTSNWDNNLST